MGTLAAGAQLFLTMGQGPAPACQVGTFSYENAAFAALPGRVLWGKALDWLTLADAVLACAAGIIATYQPEPK